MALRRTLVTDDEREFSRIDGLSVENWLRWDSRQAAGPLRSHWRRGIGRRLAAEVEGWARGENVRRLTGLLQAHNARALRFAVAWGLEEELVSPRYAVIDGRAVDRVGVVKFLVT